MRIIFLLFFVIILASCTKNPFVTKIEISAADVETKKALTAEWTDKDSILKVFITNTIPISNITRYDTIDNAVVEFTINYNNLHPLTYNPLTAYYETSELPVIAAGTKISLEAKFDNQTIVQSTQVMPRIPSNIKIEFDEGYNPKVYPWGAFKIEFNDPKGENNFYIIEALGVGIEKYGEHKGQEINFTFFVSTKNVLVEYDASYKVFIRDNAFDGNSISIQGSVFTLLDQIKELTIRLRSVTKEGYDYELSAAKIFENKSNPLAEPVILSNNIQNGVGVFSLSRLFEKVVRR